MKNYKHEVWIIFKEWRRKTHKNQRYIRNIDYLQECLQNNCIPKRFNTQNKTTYIYEDLRKKYTELNHNVVSDYLPLLIEWINSNITVLGTKIEYLESQLRRVASESDHLELRNMLLKEQERINRRSRNKQQRKLDSLLNRNTNETCNETNSVDTTQNYTMNRTALFVIGRNRRKNKNNARRRK